MSILDKCILSGTETKGIWDLFDQSNEHVMFHYRRVALVSSFFKDAHKEQHRLTLTAVSLVFHCSMFWICQYWDNNGHQIVG